MLFAGLTGVGKTELAKRIAEVYSTSRRLQVYSMGNFTEPHNVSGLIGVPPGYVGHAGTAGSCRLRVGLGVDGRCGGGGKAHADRAIFMLTTNAGDRHIAQLAEAGEHVESELPALTRDDDASE